MGARAPEKFFDKIVSVELEATVDSDFAKLRFAEVYAEQIQSSTIVKGGRPNSPIDEGWWLWRLQHDAGQIDVAPAFDVEL